MNDTLLNNALNKIQSNTKLLFVWSGDQVPDRFQTIIERFQERVGNENKIHVENVQRLSMAAYADSTFDCIVANVLTHETATYESKLVECFLKLLKPKGQLIAFVLAAKTSLLQDELKLCGFLNVVLNENENVASLFGEKPHFELGSSSKLKFASKASVVPAATESKIWKLDQDDVQEDDMDLINTDDLLDDLDLKKPTLVDKFDCGTGNDGKKKACKNCSCGLAQEIEDVAANAYKQKATAEVKSSCGSCYLGDAFRCASCPYAGMPAFKPGEKVKLSEQLIKADI